MRTLDLRADPEADLTEVVGFVRAGGLVVYPTETVYVIGGACTRASVAAVRRLGGGAADQLLAAVVPSREWVASLRWTPDALELASVFWPGSVTLVLDDPESTFPEGVRSPAGTVGVRMTPHPVAARLVAALGAGLTAGNVDLPGRPPVTSGSQAREILERRGASDVLLLDVGTLPRSPPSTIVDCTGETPIVLRSGAVPTERLRCAIPETHERSSE